MKTNLIILLLFQLVSSCKTSDVPMETPQAYRFEIKWGLISPNNDIQKLTYNTNENSLTLSKCNILDSIISSETFKITRPTADSIFYLCNKNSNKNNILESDKEMILDGYILQISLDANHKTVTDKYGSQRNDIETENRLSEIYAILNRITFNKANLSK